MNSIFYQGNQVISGDFKGERTTSDGSVILLEKIERKTRCILRYCNRLFDRRKQCLVKYSMYTQVCQKDIFFFRKKIFFVILLNNLQLSILSVVTFIFIKRFKYPIYNFVLKSPL